MCSVVTAGILYKATSFSAPALALFFLKHVSITSGVQEAQFELLPHSGHVREARGLALAWVGLFFFF